MSNPNNIPLTNNASYPPQMFVQVPMYNQSNGTNTSQPQQIPVYYPQMPAYQSYAMQTPQQPQPQMVFVSQQQTQEQKIPLISNNVENPWRSNDESNLPIKQRLLNRDFHMSIPKWWNEAWKLFSEHWLLCVVYTLLLLLVSCIPYIGGIISFGMAPGFFIAGAHAIRPNGSGWNWKSLFHGYLFYFPLLFISILYLLAVAVGFFLLIVPGFYFMVVLSFSTYIFVEYRCEGIGIIDSLTVSRKLLTRNFCHTLLLFWVVLVVNLIAALCFFVGLLVSIPFTSFIMLFAFRDIFGLSDKHLFDRGCVCC